MRAVISPSKAKGTIGAPPSKSLAHRYIICAALAEGRSVITNVDLSEDIRATLDCVMALGAKVSVESDEVVIDGINQRSIPESIDFYCRESGSTMRFFMGLAMYFGKPSRFYGSTTLRNRPFGIYEDICNKQNITFLRNEDHIFIEGKITGGEYEIPGNISSQFITGLLYVLPLLAGDSIISLIPPVESRSYIDLTLQAMKAYGVEADWKSETELVIKGSQSYKPCDIRVEGDCSNAAFLEAFNYIGGEVTVDDVNKDTLQGDRVYKELFDRLKGGEGEIDISDCPDLGPILFAVAAALKGGYFTGTRRLKIKESDRGSVMCQELSKFGVESVMDDNSITIKECNELKKPNVVMDGHNDHRIVMSETVLLSISGGEIEGAEAVRKSYPNFFEDMKSIGIKVELV